MVDFNRINELIDEGKWEIGLIRIIYEDVDDFQMIELKNYQDGRIVGGRIIHTPYPETLSPLHIGKVTGVTYDGENVMDEFKND